MLLVVKNQKNDLILSPVVFITLILLTIYIRWFMEISILDDSHIYYFQHERKKLYCGNCDDSDANKPPFLGLTPDSLLKVESENLLIFLNTLSLEDNKKYVIVLSPTDTIKNKSLHIIKKFFSDKNALVGIQKCTEESFYVYRAKRLNKAYNPLKNQWKYGFDVSLPWDQKGMDKNEIDSFDFQN